jgi:phospholipid/cholesterol/gamma-HCH transport system substrate-binding protein
VPSQKQVRWAELRVGITVLVAAIIFAGVVLLMTGTTGLFTRKIHLRAYFENAEGLREGAPVSLQGVEIGNVTRIAIVSRRPATPVEVIMRVTTRYQESLRKNSVAVLSTKGALGETYVDITGGSPKERQVRDWDELPVEERPGLQDVVRSSQDALLGLQVVLKRVDHIVAAIESGNGTAGKFIYDPSIFNKINAATDELRQTMRDINQGKGTVGKLIHDDELYRKANASVDKLNKIIDGIEKGEGTAGKLIKDPSLYENANKAASSANRIMADVEAGKGTLGRMTKDEEFSKKVDNLGTRLSAISTRLEAGEGSAGKFLRDPSLYTNSDQMLLETRGLIKAIRENPKKYLTIHFRVF